MRKILVTGAAGFVGYHVARRLLETGVHVVGLDNLNDYYSVQLKRDRLARLRRSPSFEFAQCDVADAAGMQALFAQHRFDRVVHLAAQAGVRHSLTHPHVYTRSNIEGFLNILEGARHTEVPHLVYASSSSVYGANTRLPFAVGDNVDHPISLYAATKKANELMAHSYSHLYRLPTTGLRFFTVYGPWGRPDMALWLFTKAILAGQPIQVFNEGRMRRDFTYVDDIVEAVVRVMDRIPSANPAWDGAAPDPASSNAPYQLYNIGNNRSVELLHLIETLENCLGRKAKRELLPMQPGDVPETCADVDALMRDVGFGPDTPIETGISRFVEWYLEYHKVVRPGPRNIRGVGVAHAGPDAEFRCWPELQRRPKSMWANLLTAVSQFLRLRWTIAHGGRWRVTPYDHSNQGAAHAQLLSPSLFPHRRARWARRRYELCLSPLECGIVFTTQETESWPKARRR